MVHRPDYGGMITDYSPSIDSLFAGPPIKKRLPEPISWSTAIAAFRYRLRKGDFP
jgi:hypothetical protein